MKYFYFALLLSATLTACKSAQHSTQPSAASIAVTEIPASALDSTIIVLEVELADELDTVHLPAYCGIIMWRETYNYKVVKVIGGKYDGSEILINHTCPRELVENNWLENGKVYTYKLKRRLGATYLGNGEFVTDGDMGDYEQVR